MLEVAKAVKSSYRAVTEIVVIFYTDFNESALKPNEEHKCQRLFMFYALN
jgi:hypothetical protein